jgi:hypothetical protein
MFIGSYIRPFSVAIGRRHLVERSVACVRERLINVV